MELPFKYDLKQKTLNIIIISSFIEPYFKVEMILSPSEI